MHRQVSFGVQLEIYLDVYADPEKAASDGSWCSRPAEAACCCCVILTGWRLFWRGADAGECADRNAVSLGRWGMLAVRLGGKIGTARRRNYPFDLSLV